MAAKALGWEPENAIGRGISKGEPVPGIVKAVVKNFHFHSLHEPITPLILFLDEGRTNSMFIKILPGDLSGTLSDLKKVWDQRVTHRPFEYHFLDEDYDALYKTEQRTGEIFTTFSALAILLACLGLFALAAFAITRRTKEIGIRKVLGASVPGIMRMLSQDFLKLILIAAVITFPIAWWAMHKWLMDFAYRVNIGWWVFVVAAMAAMLIALIAISFHSIKAAIANPVKSLRTE